MNYDRIAIAKAADDHTKVEANEFGKRMERTFPVVEIVDLIDCQYSLR